MSQKMLRKNPKTRRNRRRGRKTKDQQDQLLHIEETAYNVARKVYKSYHNLFGFRTPTELFDLVQDEVHLYVYGPGQDHDKSTDEAVRQGVERARNDHAAQNH